jgi:hypothetical protein
MYVTSSTAGRRGILHIYFERSEFCQRSSSSLGAENHVCKVDPDGLLSLTARLKPARCVSFHRFYSRFSGTYTAVGPIESGTALRCALIVGC